MSEQTILAIIALGIQAVALVAVLFVARRDRYQFSLRTILLRLIPLTAIFVWILTWDGPLVSNRRVVTHKTGLLVVILGVSGLVAMWHRGWLPTQALAIFLILWSLLFGWLAWKRHHDLPREQLQGFVRGARRHFAAVVRNAGPNRQFDSTTSPPARVERARQREVSMSSWIKCDEPSAITTWTPPGWWLRDVTTA